MNDEFDKATQILMVEENPLLNAEQKEALITIFDIIDRWKENMDQAEKLIKILKGEWN